MQPLSFQRASSIFLKACSNINARVPGSRAQGQRREFTHYLLRMSTALPNYPPSRSRPRSPSQCPSNSAPGNSAFSRSNSTMTSSVRGTQPSTTFCELARHGLARTPWSDTPDQSASAPAPCSCRSWSAQGLHGHTPAGRRCLEDRWRACPRER